ncbi:MAG: DeoR family transcriptional regulator [bacterium]|jgi:hypothetical protein|nr:DeoR family transcriptional regulator [bacterium]
MSPDFVKQKAREISYALLRVAFYIKRVEFRSRLEVLAVELLENASRISVDASLENTNKAVETVSVLDGLIRLAHSIYEIEPVNATILVRELDGLSSAIRQVSENSQNQSGNPVFNSELPNLESLFSKVPVAVTSSVKPVSSYETVNLNSFENNQEPTLSDNKANGNGNSLNTAIRQSAIINRVRSGNGNGCRLKELITDFSDVSERTLRYDLQRLCDQGVIERVGNGGPASYYRYKKE